MKRTKIIALFLATVSIVSVFSGCSSAKKTDDGKITIRMWSKTGADAEEVAVKLNEESEKRLIEKFPEYNFEFLREPTGGVDYRQEYDKALMAGTEPSFYTKFSYTDIPARIENGTVADITSFMENWELKKEGKILTIFDEAISKNGKWYALPNYAYTQATMANLKTLAAAGHDTENLPATWDEFAKVGTEITDLSVPRLGYAMIGMDWCAWPFTAWVWSAGGEMVEKNADGTYKISFNSEAGVDAAEYMNKLIWEHKITQKDVLADLGSVYKDFINGTTAFAWYNMSSFEAEELAKYDLMVSDFAQMPMPVKDVSIPRPALAGGEVITFSPKLTEAELDAALKVVDWLYFSDESMQRSCDNIKEYSIVNTNVPGRVDWYERKLEANSQVTDKQREEFIELSENAKPEPYCAHWTELKSELVAPLQKIYITEGISRDEIKALLDGCADKLYQLYPDTFKK